MSVKLPIEILGTGCYLPDTVLNNQYFAERLDTSDEWIVARTGIRERHKAADDQASSDLAVIAGQRALEDAGLSTADIDAIVCATATGDHQFPSTAAFIQAGMGIREIPAFDLSAACAGFLYGAVVASGLIASGMYERILVVGAETLTRFADPEDRSTVVIFGDGAGAAVLARSRSKDCGVLFADMGCAGEHAQMIWVPAGGSRLPTTESTAAERLQFLRMRGREVYKFAVLKMQSLIDRALDEAGLKPDDLAMVIPHQSNLRIIESARERLGLPREKIAVNIDRCGNTSAASIPMALDEARRAGKLSKGDLILMVGIGAGLTWSTMIMRL